MTARLVACAVLIVILCAPGVALSQVQTHLGGETSWWSVGDYLKFLGDSNTITLPCGDCGTDCEDTGMVFQRVATYDPTTCSGTPGAKDKRYMCHAEGCLLLGSGPYGNSSSCDACNKDCLCQAIFQVVSKATVSGGACYTIQLVCDPDVPCTENGCTSGWDAVCQ